jgi:hypothetical protein
MTSKVLRPFLRVKTLIRVALSVLSLGGMAQAQSSRLSPPQSGNNYNFTTGGGG